MKNAIFSYKCATLVFLTILTLVVLMLHGPVTTPARYLTLADTRSWLGIPNAWNVLSNIPFLLIGIWGLSKPGYFKNPKEKLFYVIFFIGVALVAFGSAYHHWVFDNLSLMWDRFPIGIAMIAFTCAIIAERIDLPFGRFMLWPLIALAIFSIYYWYFTVSQGREDVRVYTFILVFFPIILIPLTILMFKATYSHTKYLWFALISFLVARITEGYDLAIYNYSGHFISGHTLKHLLLALSCLFIFIYLRRRTALK